MEQISEDLYALPVDQCVYTISTAAVDPNLDNALLWQANADWEQMPQSLGNHQIVSYGTSNNLPEQVRELMDGNNLAPGILNRQKGLLFGQGAHLRKLEFVGGEIQKLFVEDREIERWLESWDYNKYIDKALTDYLHLKGFFDLKILERGHRIRQAPRIAALEHVSPTKARLEWSDTRNLADVKNIIVGNMQNGHFLNEYRAYPIFDPRNPGKAPVTASYNCSYSFARDFYSVPEYWGALRWILRGSEVPKIFKYVTDNGFNAAYHIHSPMGYWDDKREILQRMHSDWSDAKIEEGLAEVKNKIFTQLTDVLSGAKNAGKFFHSVDIIDPMKGELTSWKIEAIDQKVKDFVDAQLKILEASSSAITSGMGLHPTLSNISINGRLASGSEILYAYKLFLLSDTALASSVVLEPINQAIKINFPNSNLKLDFYQSKVLTESEVSPSERVKN